MSDKNYSYLPGCGTAEVAQNKAAKSILEWANTHLPEHHADADEPSDQIESVGFSAVMYNPAAELTECLGFSCLMPSHVCDVCKFFKGDEVSEAFTEISRILSMGPLEVLPPIKSVVQSWHDARHELYSSAPASRGGRAFAELNVYERMKF
jgi:hypothetical protein